MAEQYEENVENISNENTQDNECSNENKEQTGLPWQHQVLRR